MRLVGCVLDQGVFAVVVDAGDLVFDVFECLDVVFHKEIAFFGQFVGIYLFLSWQEIVGVVNESGWSVDQVAGNLMVVKFLEYLYFILSVLFEIGNYRLTI